MQNAGYPSQIFFLWKRKTKHARAPAHTLCARAHFALEWRARGKARALHPRMRAPVKRAEDAGKGVGVGGGGVGRGRP